MRITNIFSEILRELNLENFVVAAYSEQQSVWGQLIQRDEQCKFEGVFFYTPSANGLTHILRAASEKVNGIYINCAKPLVADHIASVGRANFCFLDNIDSNLLEDIEVQIQVQDIFDNIKRNSGKIVVGSHQLREQLGGLIGDLQTRFFSLKQLELEKLSKVDMYTMISKRARLRGITNLNEETFNYLYYRSERNIKTLMQYLDKIDIASLDQNQKVQIRHVRRVLENEQGRTV